MNSIEFLKKWVLEKESFSFFLPEGPQGRPFDNQYRVESIIEKQCGMTIKMSGGIEFEFEGKVQHSVEACNLILTNFSKLEYKVDGRIEKKYLGGEFCLSGF